MSTEVRPGPNRRSGRLSTCLGWALAAHRVRERHPRRVAGRTLALVVVQQLHALEPVGHGGGDVHSWLGHPGTGVSVDERAKNVRPEEKVFYLKVKSGSVAGRAPWLVAVLAHSGGFQGVLRALYDYKTSLVDTRRKRTPIFPQKTKNTRLEPCRLTG